MAASGAVLLVDDNASKRMAVQAMLSPLGYDVVEADSGRAALRAVLGRHFAVILMDVRMPTMDGYETAKLIRGRMQSELTPIIFLTAFGTDETETDSAYASGAVDFIFAPIRADILRAKVSAFVDLFAQQQQLQESLVEITALNAELRDAHASAEAVLQNVADAIVTSSEDGAIGGVQPIGATAVRLLRGRARGPAPGAHHPAGDGRRGPHRAPQGRLVLRPRDERQRDADRRSRRDDRLHPRRLGA